MKLRRGLGIALFGAGLVVLSCSADRASVRVEASADASASPASATTLVESRTAATRITELRTRFRVPVRAAEDDRAGLARATLAKRAAPIALPALGAPVATRFESAAGPDAATHVRAVLPTEVLRGVARPAHVALPVRANDEVKLEDATSHVSVRFALEHVQDARIEVAGGMALYRGALDGADVVHRVHAEGTEDFVIFETRPAREELSYSVDVSRVPGLRLVSNTLEFLDESGTPVLRVAPPYVVDANGRRREAKLAVNSCAYDTKPAGPWGREVTKPGAERCTVRVAWAGDIAYPAMVDPAWTATGSMGTARSSHTASVLSSGKVLIAGGCSDNISCPTILASAELYDPGGNGGAGTFAATGSMATGRTRHTASLLPSGKVLIAGGFDVPPSAGSVSAASAELYDPGGNGTFAATGTMTTDRDGHTATVLPSGKVLVVGGRHTTAIGTGVTLLTAELFDPAGNAGAGTFGATGSMAAARTSHTASVLPSGKVLVAGGTDYTQIFLSAELFDPAGDAGVGTFALTGPTAKMRYDHTASVLPSGKVLVFGGSGNGGPSAELFDPAGNAGAGTFTLTGSLASIRIQHTASVLPSGKVLVVGGIDSAIAGATVASAELYDPAGNAGAGTFGAAGSMTTPRRLHTASVLPSGVVLVTGGTGGGASAELFAFVAAAGACVVAGECLSGFCADGVCCDAACNGGGCDRCDVAGKVGTCSVMRVGDLGSNPTCILPYACDGVNAGCPTKCVSSAACAMGFTCDTAKATCVPARATCNDHITTGADGTTHDCVPYKCDSNGTCRAACTSVNDCVAPTICDPTGKCAPPPDDAGSSGGCSVCSARAGDARWQLAWFAAAAGLALVRRRRRCEVKAALP